LTENNWLELWSHLVTATSQPDADELVKRYETHSRKRVGRPDPLLDFVLKKVSSSQSVIDIGAGSGRWTIPIARKAKNVTAVEPTKAMENLLRENVCTAGLTNVKIIAAAWEEAVIQAVDITVCAHAMYSSPDLELFIRKMESHTTTGCYLALRLPPADGILGELSSVIFGRRYDSPDAIIAYNALYSLGIYANVLVEETILNWVNPNFEDAFNRAKRHLHMETTATYDVLIRDTLRRRLKYLDNSYIWPDGMRSVLLWWKPHQ
jgi:2-polyprenyl-3-methyl-5-hydroxy-6-metoxy-1,4-benzoquinol methylase